MPAANIPLVIDQGEDFTCQIIWTDNTGAPIPVAEPIRLDIVDQNFPILSLTTAPVEEGYIPEITYSSEIGLIQLHIPKEQTQAIAPGLYQYDMFASVDDGTSYAGNQQQRLLVGQVVINKRITVV